MISYAKPRLESQATNRPLKRVNSSEPLPDRLSQWLAGDPYLLAQGGASPSRYFDKVVELSISRGMKLVVVGAQPTKYIAELRQRWNGLLEKWVFFTGMVPQMGLATYIDHALASVVLYGNVSANNWLCAPNRLYQAISRGIPVIVGANPPMRAIVDRHRCGVVIESDGRDVGKLQDGLSVLLGQYSSFAENARQARRIAEWESQDDTILRIAGWGPKAHTIQVQTTRTSWPQA